nr:MAG TPA: hypothetical protein [Caudoviricetes sp.]
MATIEKSSGYVGNVERVIALAKAPELAHETGDVRLIKDENGVAYYKASVVIAVDRHFPTKAGNETTTAILIPIDGGKEFAFNGGKLKFDGISPFIYAGRGMSHVFTVYADNGDVMRRNTGRKSASAEIARMQEQLDTIMAALAAMAKK